MYKEYFNVHIHNQKVIMWVIENLNVVYKEFNQKNPLTGDKDICHKTINLDPP